MKTSRAYESWMGRGGVASWRCWRDWRWQVRNSLRGGRVLECLQGEGRPDGVVSEGLEARMTPYYAGVLLSDAGCDELARTVLPAVGEQCVGADELDDPLGEEAHRATSCVIHTYPDKVLFLATRNCAVHCRYCTRSRWVGRGRDVGREDWEAGLAYVRANTAVRDVLVSGGDPLLLGDEPLGWLLERLRAIRHVDIIRIGTKVPAVLPQRITTGLLKTLKRYHPLWILPHFTHEAELTEEATHACERLADSGFPLASQTVLLRGVNDGAGQLKRLFLGLLRHRVRPYYLFQCDLVRGSGRFRTTLARGQQIIRELHGFTTGLAVPTYMLDMPGGGGKVPVGPDYIECREGKDIIVRDHQGRPRRYNDSVGEFPFMRVADGL